MRKFVTKLKSRWLSHESGVMPRPLGGDSPIQAISLLGDELKVEAAGVIRTREDYKKMRKAGASRIGTSSGLAIVGEAS